MISSSPDPTRASGTALTTKTRVRGDDGLACGELLRRARQRRGLTLEQIAQSTKIPLRHLDALEKDDLASLPGGMYRRAHVRAYADAVGLDRTVALSSLDRATEEGAPPAVTPVEAPAPPPIVATSRRRVSTTGAVAVAAVAIALAIWARQPAAVDTASSSAPAPVSQPPSAGIPEAQPATYVRTATSDHALEPASASTDRRIEPAAVAPLSTTQPATDTSRGTAGATSTAEPQLTIVTEPAGARVTVNGIGWGVTPVTIRYLEPGAKRVRVTREGFQSEERFIQLDDSRARMTVRIPLRNVN
jgi:cytoskeletal protein RodZ